MGETQVVLDDERNGTAAQTAGDGTPGNAAENTAQGGLRAVVPGGLMVNVMPGAVSGGPVPDHLLSGPGADLYAAVERLRRELAAYQPLLLDRAVAEDELAALVREALMADEETCLLKNAESLRHSLLLVAAVVGSVSALSAPLKAVYEALEALVPPK